MLVNTHNTYINIKLRMSHELNSSRNPRELKHLVHAKLLLEQLTSTHIDLLFCSPTGNQKL